MREVACSSLKKCGTEVVRPLSDTVRFIYDNKRHLLEDCKKKGALMTSQSRKTCGMDCSSATNELVTNRSGDTNKIL